MASARFRPTRAGIVNLWDYRDQEFSFADGRLVLRGPNGSGKTKALEVLFPFVLDGRIEPRRLNPFAGEERTMKSNLLYRGEDSVHAYVWMEFARGDAADPEAVTVGIGMRASRQNDKVTRWHFVADGRVGVDFSLLAAGDQPVTKKQLAEQIGGDAICDRPVDYRAAIDARLFGLGAQRYDQLITLILTLRRPQLAKNLDPKGLSQALTDGLRPLDEHLVLEAARSFSDMEEVGRALEGLTAADQATGSFIGVYTKYLRQQARTDVEQVARRIEAVTAATAALEAAVADRTRRQTERAESEQRVAAADRALDLARGELETLQRSTAYEGKQQLDDLAAVVADLHRSTEAQSDKARKAQSSLAQRAEEAAQSQARVTRAVDALARAEDELQSAATDAGIDWAALPDEARGDQLTTTVRGHAEERTGDVRVVRESVAAAQRAGAERERAQRATDRGRELLDAATVAVKEAEARTALARSETSTAVRRWWTTHSSLYARVGISSDLFVELHESVAAIGDDEAPTFTEILDGHTTDPIDTVRAGRARAETDAAQATAEITALTADRARIAAEHDDAPPPIPFRTDDRSTLSGAPLWRLVRFADHVDAADAAGIEAALTAAQLLDGWVPAADGPLPDHESEQFLVPLPAADRPDGATLADVLVAEPDTGVPAERVGALLSSIALHTGSGDGPGVGVSGRFRQGIQVGRHTKAAAEFIGVTARQRRREQRLRDLDAALEQAQRRRDRALDEQSAAADLVTALTAAGRALPRPSAVQSALRAVSEAAGALRSRDEAASATQQELDQAIAELAVRDRALREAAARHRVPSAGPGADAAWGPALDALAAAIRHFETRGDLVVRCRRDREKENEHRREAADRHAEARDVAEEFTEEADLAVAKLEHQEQNLQTLRDSLGAGADEIDAEIASARDRIDAATTEQRAARRAYDSAVEWIGKTEGAHGAAALALRGAITETRSDAQRLAPYARRDLLELLGVDTAHGWPASDAAWLTTDQLVYRIDTEPGAPVAVVPDEVAALQAALESATASVKVSEAAGKSTRSALTGALQDFDARLAAAGQDYRLRWDAADGLTTVTVQHDQGLSSIGDFAALISARRADQQLLLTDSERRILEDALLTGLAHQIHERTVDARDLIAQMSSEMRERRMSSGTTIGVHWVLADSLDEPTRAVSKLLDRDASALGPDELATIRAHFATRIRALRAAHPERAYPEILTEALDYRRWRVFSLSLVSGDGTEERLTAARHGALSGGEQSVSLHLPLFAAAHAMLSSADPHAPRLLGLDEAFAGVDDNGRSELLGLSVQFDLDLFMTGYDLWVTYPDVPGCAHYDLSHSTPEHTVSATLMVWDGGMLMSEHDGTNLARALGSPLRRRVPTSIDGGLALLEV
ncbi:TIGR02680 family protein [Rhodococcus sp. NPDC058505]|uniref:TIGR02680 family protein n=1 Tax=Rhodococcus sp. NPDC058505 TaxID=3346531 RepID=UPI003649004F